MKYKMENTSKLHYTRMNECTKFVYTTASLKYAAMQIVEMSFQAPFQYNGGK